MVLWSALLLLLSGATEGGASLHVATRWTRPSWQALIQERVQDSLLVIVQSRSAAGLQLAGISRSSGALVWEKTVQASATGGWKVHAPPRVGRQGGNVFVVERTYEKPAPIARPWQTGRTMDLTALFWKNGSVAWASGQLNMSGGADVGGGLLGYDPDRAIVVSGHTTASQAFEVRGLDARTLHPLWTFADNYTRSYSPGTLSAALDDGLSLDSTLVSLQVRPIGMAHVVPHEYLDLAVATGKEWAPSTIEQGSGSDRESCSFIPPADSYLRLCDYGSTSNSLYVCNISGHTVGQAVNIPADPCGGGIDVNWHRDGTVVLEENHVLPECRAGLVCPCGPNETCLGAPGACGFTVKDLLRPRGTQWGLAFNCSNGDVDSQASICTGQAPIVLGFDASADRIVTVEPNTTATTTTNGSTTIQLRRLSDGAIIWPGGASLPARPQTLVMAPYASGGVIAAVVPIAPPSANRTNGTTQVLLFDADQQSVDGPFWQSALFPSGSNVSITFSVASQREQGRGLFLSTSGSSASTTFLSW